MTPNCSHALRCREEYHYFSHIHAHADGVNLGGRAPVSVGDEALSGTTGENLLNGLGDIGEMGLGGEVQGLNESTFGIHAGKNTFFVDIHAGDLLFIDDGSGDHITSSEGLFVLLVCEDILGSDHGLGGSMLAGLGSGEGGDLAGESLFHDDEGARLHAASISELSVEGTGVTGFEFVIGHI